MGPVRGVHPNMSGSSLLATTAAAIYQRADDRPKDGKAQRTQ